MNYPDIENMSANERLQIMEAIWDSFKYEKNEIDTPEWHEQILDERKGKIVEGKAKFISLDDLKAIK